MLNAIELAVLGFAAYRVTQLIVFDSILDRWRHRLELWHARRFDSRARTFVRDLLKCPFCVGFHVSWLTVLAYLLGTGRWVPGFGGFLIFGIHSFAVAGVQACLSRWENTLD